MPAPKFEILACEPSPLGLLVLRRRELLGEPGKIVTEVTLDNEFLMSSYITFSERALAAVALDMHPGKDLNVLVGGLGLGYTAREALASERLNQVEVVEFLPQIMGWLDRGLVPLSGELNADPRFRVVEGDVYARLAGPPDRKYDLILVDVDHSPDEALGDQSDSFYSVSGLRKAAQHLAPGGVLGVWSYAGHSPFADALRAVFPEVRVEPVTYMNDLVYEELTDWLFFGRSAP